MSLWMSLECLPYILTLDSYYKYKCVDTSVHYIAAKVVDHVFFLLFTYGIVQVQEHYQ
jgi:hypothetical protein